MPLFSEEWISELLGKVSLADLIGEYVTLQNKSGRWWACCPFHNEKTPSFSVNPEKGFYHCFGCGKSGNAIQFVMEQDKMTFPEACQYLAEKVKLPIPEMTDHTDYEKRKKLREQIYEMNKIAAQYFHKNLYAAEGKSALEYLYNRGIDDRMIKTFGMGYARDGWDHLMKLLAEQGYTKQEMQMAGLIKIADQKSYDMFRNRAIIPIINTFGNVIGFGGRVMDDGMPKYLNSPETATFNKSRNLYNLNLVRRQKNLAHLILVEGYMDVIALFSYGIPECVATLGTALTQDQARIIKRYTSHVYISYDGDGAGQKATLRALDILDKEGIETRVVSIPDGQDPDEYLKEHGKAGYVELMKTSLPMMDYKFGNAAQKYDLSDSYQKEKFAQECVEMLKHVTSAMMRERYMKKLSELTGFSVESISQDAGGLKGSDADWKPPEMKKKMFTAAEEKIENKLIRMICANPEVVMQKIGDRLVVEDFQSGLYKKIFAWHYANKGKDIQNGELLLLNELDEIGRAEVAEMFDNNQDARTMMSDDLLDGHIRQMQMARLERHKKKLFAACNAEQDITKKQALLKQVDEISKQMHKLKTSF